MKLKQVPAKMSLLTMMSLGLAQGAQAEFEATKLGSLADSVTIHSELYLQHYMESLREGDELRNEPRGRFKPVLGAKFFDDAVDAFFVGYFDHKPQTTTFESYTQSRFYLVGSGWTVADILTIQPWARHQFAQKLQDKYNEGKTLLASTQTLSYELSTGIGAIAPAFGVEIGATITNRPTETTYGVEGELASLTLTEADKLRIEVDKDGQKLKGQQKHPGYYHEWFAGVNYVPNALSDLSVNLTAFYTNSIDPEYTVDQSKNVEHKYVLKKETSERLRISYQVSDALVLRNDFYGYHNGLYQRKVDEGSKAYLNEFGVVYNLF